MSFNTADNYGNLPVKSLLKKLSELDSITQGELKQVKAIDVKPLEEITLNEVKLLDRLALQYLGTRIRGGFDGRTSIGYQGST